MASGHKVQQMLTELQTIEVQLKQAQKLLLSIPIDSDKTYVLNFNEYLAIADTAERLKRSANQYRDWFYGLPRYSRY